MMVPGTERTKRNTMTETPSKVNIVEMSRRVMNLCTDVASCSQISIALQIR